MGEWYSWCGELICSECQITTLSKFDLFNNFCPKCGVKMVGIKKALPPVKYVPEKHGFWRMQYLNNEYIITCSKCKNYGHTQDKYCRFCGAKMDLKESEDEE